ncbi:MAG: glycosyltransferase [Chloroflexi bacterium]|nr:MAG: glycosyltransferase [Chloroflexota bacterium]
MKVLQIIDNLYTGGAERVMVNMCNWLDQAGVEIVPVLIDGRGTDLLSEIHTRTEPVILKRKGRLDFSAANRLAALMKETDIVHVHMRYNFRYVYLIKWLFGLSKPIILHDHFGKIKIDKRVPFGFRWIFRPAAYIGVSTELVQWAKDNLKTSNKDSFWLLQNAISREGKAAIPCLGNKSALVLVSNIKKVKNQQFALNLAEKGDLTIDFIGQIQDENYFNELIKYVRERQIERQTRFLHDVTNVQRLLGGYRLGIHTSISETGPLTIIEYLAQGLPFVAYRTGEAAEKIAEEFPEFFLDTFEVDAWLDRIRYLLESPPDKEKMGAVFDKHFSKENYIAQCLDIYHRILGC